MFFGSYSHSVDEKGRLRIPSKLKTGITGSYVITKGLDNCLYVFNKTYFESEFLAEINSIFPYAQSGNKSLRAILSSTYEVEEDNQGRFIIPSGLKEYAGINKNLTSVGVGNRIEIWDAVAWAEYVSATTFSDAVKELNSKS